MRIRFDMPEPGLSRAAKWSLLGSFLLILGFFFLAGIWRPVWQLAEMRGMNPRIDPPVSVMAEGDDDQENRPVLSIARDGGIWHEHKRCDPVDLDGAMEAANLAFRRKCRMQGKNASQELPGGMSASRLILLLRVDRAAPWGAVHDVLRHAAEHGLYRIQFLARRRDDWSAVFLWAALPGANEPRAPISVSVRQGPGGSAVFSLAGADAPDPDLLRERLVALYRSACDADPRGRVVAAIEATHDVPFEAIVRALDAFAFLNFDWVHLEADGLRAEIR